MAISRWRALFLLLVMGSLWGLQFAMLKLAATGGYGDVTILMTALFALSIIFLVILLVRKLQFRLSARLLGFMVNIALMGYVLPLAAAIAAAPHLPAGIITFLGCLSPVATLGVAMLVRSEVISPSRLWAVALGVAAVMLIVLPELTLPDGGAVWWLVVALVIPVTYGIEPVYVAARWPTGLGPLQVLTGETIVAAVLVFPFYLMFGSQSGFGGSFGTAEAAIAIFVACGVVESLIYFYLIKTTGGVFVSFGTFASLFAGLMWGMVLFGERHADLIWLAVVMLCVALYLATRDRPAGEGADQ